MPAREHTHDEEFDDSNQGGAGWEDMHKLGALTQASGTWHESSEPDETFDQPAPPFNLSGTMMTGTNPLAVSPITPQHRKPRRAMPYGLSPPPRLHEFRSHPPTTSGRKNQLGSRHILLLLMGVIAAVGLGAIVALITKESPVVKVVDFSIDVEGHDRLTVNCPSCENGSRIRLDGPWSVLQDKQAQVFPKEKLQIGPNLLRFEIETPGGAQLEAKTITLPVAFRLTTQWLRPSGKGPEALVRVEVPLNSQVRINGEEVDLVAGLATKSLSYEAQTTGNTPLVESLNLTLNVDVTSGDETRSATTTLRGRVCPLVVSASTPQGEGGPPFVSGTTTPGATLFVGGNPVHTEISGKFEHRLGAQITAPILVVASTSELLPRRVILARD